MCVVTKLNHLEWVNAFDIHTHVPWYHGCLVLLFPIIDANIIVHLAIVLCGIVFIKLILNSGCNKEDIANTFKNEKIIYQDYFRS